jgi:hypothetical protein
MIEEHDKWKKGHDCLLNYMRTWAKDFNLGPLGVSNICMAIVFQIFLSRKTSAEEVSKFLSDAMEEFKFCEKIESGNELRIEMEKVFQEWHSQASDLH